MFCVTVEQNDQAISEIDSRDSVQARLVPDFEGVDLKAVHWKWCVINGESLLIC